MNTTYFLNLVAGNVFRSKTSPSIPAEYYIGLSRAAPTVSGSNVSEPSGNGYARVRLTGLTTPANGTVTNTAIIEFPESTASWGTITHFVVYDARTGGNLLMYGRLQTSRAVEPATIMTIKPGALTLSVVNTDT